MLKIRDYALVAFLLLRGFKLERNTDGSYDCYQDVSADRQEYNQEYKPILDGIKRIKRGLTVKPPIDPP